MKERPILFSGEMVRALLDGRKTQTRRIVTPQPWGVPVPRLGGGWLDKQSSTSSVSTANPKGEFEYPYGKPGDRLWVRETFGEAHLRSEGPTIVYRATDGDRPVSKAVEKWKPSIFMPRSACRLLLEVVSVRVERLQEISEADAAAEGVENREFSVGVLQHLVGGKDYNVPVSLRGGYCNLWNRINAKRGFSWAVNPWVWVIEFKKIKP